MVGEWTRPAVLLVPGWSDTGRTLRHCAEFLQRSGWPATHVHAVDFVDRYGSNIVHAAEIAAAAEELRQRAGTPAIGVVAHSMGGLALRYYVSHGGAEAVHTAVFVATPHAGTVLAYVAWGRGGREMRPDSAFLRALNARRLPPHIRAHCIRTPADTRVVPHASAWALDGAECHTVRLPGHPRLLRHRATLELIRELLLRPR